MGGRKYRSRRPVGAQPGNRQLRIATEPFRCACGGRRNRDSGRASGPTRRRGTQPRSPAARRAAHRRKSRRTVTYRPSAATAPQAAMMYGPVVRRRPGAVSANDRSRASRRRSSGPAGSWPSSSSLARLGAYLLYEHFQGNIRTVDVGRRQQRFHRRQGHQYPADRHGQAHRQGQRGLRGQGQRRPRRHQYPVSRLQGPHQRDRALHPPGPDHGHPGLQDQTARRQHQDHPGYSAESASTPASGQDDRDPGCTMATVKKITGIDRRPLHDGRLQRGQDADVRRSAGSRSAWLTPVDDKESHLKLPAGQVHRQGRAGTRRSYGPGTASATRATSTASKCSSSSSPR